MERVTNLGIDLAKSVFQLHGVDARGRKVLGRRLSRSGLMKLIATLPACRIGMEATGGASFWARECRKHGHEVRLMAAQFVKPFVKSDKNDRNDAEAICEAMQRPNMRFVAEKSIEQQGIQMVHRVRSRRVATRTEVCNEIRAMLHELGIVAPMGLKKLRERVMALLSEASLAPQQQRLLEELFSEWNALDSHVTSSDNQVERIFDEHEVCRRLATIPGVGALTATALYAAIGNIDDFKSGRHLAAWFGLVPRQYSSGAKQRLLGITKRGDSYIRSLLIHGGRAVVLHAGKKSDARSRWILEKAKARGKNKAAVAVANKNARVIWKLMKTTESYRTNP